MNQLEQTIIAILSEAKSQDASSVLRTALVKYIYLLDVYTAEETNGSIFSGLDWQFVHFGPYAASMSQAIDALSASGAINEYTNSREGDGAGYSIYSLKASSKVVNHKELGISAGVWLRLSSDIRRYKNSLPKLLDYVYFETTPMKGAVPGSTLDFNDCEKLSLRRVEMTSLPKKKIRKTLDKLRAMIEEDKQAISSSPFKAALYDDAYFEAMAIADAEPLDVGLSGRARLE